VVTKSAKDISGRQIVRYFGPVEEREKNSDETRSWKLMKMPADEKGRRSVCSNRQESMIVHQGLQTQRDVVRKRGARRQSIFFLTENTVGEVPTIWIL
jgi:hypothetical protein